VRGEVDIATSALLAAAIARAMAMEPGGPVDLAIDLAHVRFIDASGIRVLLNATNQARARGGTLVLRSPSRAVRRLLDVLRLDGVLAVERPESGGRLRRWRPPAVVTGGPERALTLAEE
jgi:anti-anti-sigma factor